MRYGARLCCMLLIMEGAANSVAAEPTQERLALALSGPDCASQRPSIVAALVRISGVGHVDVASVPDHALVDVTYEAITPDELRAAAARGVTPGSQCRVEIMKSCISANLSPPDR